MNHTGRVKPRNALLRALPELTFEALKPDMEPVSLPLRFKLAEPARPSKWIYFPESGLASVVGQVGSQTQEIGIFGKDGGGCLSGVLGSRGAAPYMIIMQVAGEGHRISAKFFSQVFESDPALRDVVLRYVQSFIVQLSQSCIANVQYNTVQRMARWFLMVHDRLENESINLTHDFIATMLGVGRTGVTLALHALENAGLISTARKRITILDRQGLEIMTQPVYGFAEGEYRRLFDEEFGPERNVSTRS